MDIKECHVILDQSQRRISYVHLCKNTNPLYSPTGEYNSKNKFTKWRLAAVLYKLRTKK